MNPASPQTLSLLRPIPGGEHDRANLIQCGYCGMFAYPWQTTESGVFIGGSIASLCTRCSERRVAMRAFHSSDHNDDHDDNDETILGWDHRRHGGGLLTDQGDLLGLPTGDRGKPSPALICLLAFVIVMAAALALKEATGTADVQKAAGQTVGYRNTPPLSATAAATSSPLSSSADAIPLQEILTGVPPRDTSIAPLTHSTISSKETR